MSGSGQRFWAWVIVAVVVGATALGLRIVGSKSEPTRPGGRGFTETLPPNVTLRLRNVRITGRANGAPAWRLRAGIVDGARGQTQVNFTDGIEADFLQNGQSHATVTAPRAVYNVSAKTVEASGGVLCRVAGPKRTPGDELRIETPQVTWGIGARQIACPSQVKVSRPNVTVRGDNLSVDLVTQAYSLHNMTGEFLLDEDADPGELLGILPQAQQ